LCTMWNQSNHISHDGDSMGNNICDIHRNHIENILGITVIQRHESKRQ
jgi:hypothetical protein